LLKDKNDLFASTVDLVTVGALHPSNEDSQKAGYLKAHRSSRDHVMLSHIYLNDVIPAAYSATVSRLSYHL